MTTALAIFSGLVATASADVRAFFWVVAAVLALVAPVLWLAGDEKPDRRGELRRTREARREKKRAERIERAKEGVERRAAESRLRNRRSLVTKLKEHRTAYEDTRDAAKKHIQFAQESKGQQDAQRFLSAQVSGTHSLNTLPYTFHNRESKLLFDVGGSEVEHHFTLSATTRSALADMGTVKKTSVTRLTEIAEALRSLGVTDE